MNDNHSIARLCCIFALLIVLPFFTISPYAQGVVQITEETNLSSQHSPIFSNMMPSTNGDTTTTESSLYYKLFHTSTIEMEPKADVQWTGTNKLSEFDKADSESTALSLDQSLTEKSGNPTEWYFREVLTVPPDVLYSQTGSTLVISEVTFSDEGWYKAHEVVFGNLSVSDFFELVVLNAPIIDVQPQGAHLVAGESHTLSVSVSGGTPPYQYIWQMDSGSGFTTVGVGETLAMSNIGMSAQGVYRCIVADSATPTSLTRESDNVELTVLEIVDSPPAVLNIATTTNHTLTYIVEGGDVDVPGASSSYSHVWEFKALGTVEYTVLSNTTNQLTIVDASATIPAPSGHSGDYRYTVSDVQRSITRETRVYVDADPIVITQHPQDAGRHTGDTITFTLEASRISAPLEALNFTWQFKSTLTGTPIVLSTGGAFNISSAANASQLTIDPLAMLQNGCYFCTVETQDAQPIAQDSETARLMVGDPLQITTQPLGGAFHIGDVHAPMFYVEVSGGVGAVKCQWEQESGGGSFLSVGGNTTGLSLTPLDLSDAGMWRCLVQDEGVGDGVGITPTELQSNAVLLQVVEPVSDPFPVTASDVVISNRGDTTLHVDTTGIGGLPPYSYQWYKGDITNPLFNATTSSLALLDLSSADSGCYFCVVTDSIGGGNGTGTSSDACIQVAMPLQIISQPTVVMVEEGGVLQLSVLVDGGVYEINPLMTYSYAWEKINDPAKGIVGGDSPTLIIDPVPPGVEGDYVCTVINGEDTVVSAPITVMIEKTGVPISGLPTLCIISFALAVIGTMKVRRRRNA